MELHSRTRRNAPAFVATSLACALALIVPLARADDEPGRDRTTRAPGVEEPPEMVAQGIDLFIRAAWEEEGLAPNERCSDEEFVRRVHLDVIGTVPSAGQVERFLEDDRPDKRARLVDQLLDTPGYARHFANLWGRVLVGQGTNQNNREYNASLFRNWLEESLAVERSYGDLIRAVLTADGTIYTNAAVNFSGRRNHSPTDLAGSVSKAFLGVQIQCAQCHDHPYEDITQLDFQRFAAFWGRTTQRREVIPYETFSKRAAERFQKRYEDDIAKLVAEGMPEDQARKQAERRRPRSVSVGEIAGGSRFPRALQRRREAQIGEIAKTSPKFLLGDEYADAPGATRRSALADWVLDTDNPYTARTLANRYWGWLLGRGFVHPVDDFNSVNLPAIPAALDVLARDATDHGFDLKRLVRVITATEAYQLSTRGPERTSHGEEFFALGPLKPLTPQQMFDSLQVSLGVVDEGTAMGGVGKAMSSLEMGRGQGGMRMSEDSERSRTQRLLRGMAGKFFQTFEDDEGDDAVAFEGTIPQGLFLMNSAVVNGLLTDARVSVVPKIFDRFPNEKARVRHLFRRTLSREPTKTELREFVAFVRSQPKHVEREVETTDNERERKRKKKKLRRNRMSKEDRQTAAYADVLWTLVSTSEYGTNH